MKKSCEDTARQKTGSFPYKLDKGYFRGRQKPHGRSPCAGTPADVQIGSLLQMEESPVQTAIHKMREDTEWEYLALVGVSGELEIKKAG